MFQYEDHLGARLARCRSRRERVKTYYVYFKKVYGEGENHISFVRDSAQVFFIGSASLRFLGLPFWLSLVLMTELGLLYAVLTLYIGRRSLNNGMFALSQDLNNHYNPQMRELIRRKRKGEKRS